MGTFIQYVAFPGIVRRGMTKADFKAAGVEYDGPDIWFDKSNKNTVDASEFSEEVVELFREDGDFKIVEADSEPKAPKQVTGEDYERVMKEANKKATEGDEPPPAGDAPGGEGSLATSTADSTPVTTASSTAGAGRGTTGRAPTTKGSRA